MRVGVEVGVKVMVGVGVKVGSNNLPGLQPANKIHMETSQMCLNMNAS